MIGSLRSFLRFKSGYSVGRAPHVGPVCPLRQWCQSPLDSPVLVKLITYF